MDVFDPRGRFHHTQVYLANKKVTHPIHIEALDHKGRFYQTDMLSSRLPTELICLIFDNYLPPNPVPEDFAIEQSSYFPQLLPDADFSFDSDRRFTLASVCRHWRNVVWNNPRFWNSLYLTVDERRATSPHFTAIVKVWLNRSKELPLSLCLYCDLQQSQDPLPELESLIDVLNSAAHRWSSLSVGVPERYINCFRCNSKTSILQALELLGCRTDNWTFNADHANIILPSPSRLQVDSCHLNNIHLDFSHLTHFTGRKMWPIECIKLLHVVPRLTYCHFDSLCQRRQRPDPLPPASLPFLEHIVFDEAPAFILNYITCPRLRELWLCDVDGDHDDQLDFDTLIRFVLRSACAETLQHLKLLGYSDDDTDCLNIIQFLRLTHQLKSLVLHTLTLESVFFELLRDTAFSNSDKGTFLPNLEDFTFAGYKLFPWSAVDVMIQGHFLDAVTDPVRPLRSLRFEIKPPAELDEDDEDALDMETEDGTWLVEKYQDVAGVKVNVVW